MPALILEITLETEEKPAAAAQNGASSPASDLPTREQTAKVKAFLFVRP